MNAHTLTTPRIHFVERVNEVKKLEGGEWESGFWVVAPATAQRLVGGDLYLHSAQSKESHFGGVILSWRTEQERPDAIGRIVFRFKATMAHKGVLAGKDGWGQEMKLVLE